MGERTIEDRLREQYFEMLPEMVRVGEQLKTQIQYQLLPISELLTEQESLTVKVRIKDCVSAIDKLRQFEPGDPARRRNPGGVFDRDIPEKYDLRELRDMVGVRVLVFPSTRAVAVDALLRGQFRDWVPDPIVDAGQQLAFKYNGRIDSRDGFVPCEYQIVSTLMSFLGSRACGHLQAVSGIQGACSCHV